MFQAVNRQAECAARFYARLSHRKKALCAASAYFLLFALISTLTRFALILRGRSIVWQYDSSGEYYTTAVYFIRAVRTLLSGGGFRQFDFTIGLGGDALSSLNFYGFGDPVLLISSLVPTNNFEALFTLGVYLRQALSGYFCYLYLRQMGARRGYALVGALSLAFCAFVNRNTLRHQNFLNAMLYLPLMLMGFERLMKRGKPWVLIASVALMAASTYYFLYMASLFLLLYALVRFFQERGAVKFLPLFGKALGAWALGALIAGVVLLPSVYGLLHSARAPGSIDQGLLFYSPKDFLSLLSRYAFAQNADFETVSIWSIFAALLLLLRPDPRRRGIYAAVLALVALYVVSPLPGYVLNGFSYASNRSVFLLSLLSALALAASGDRLARLKRRELWIMTLAVAALFAAFAYSMYGSKDLSSKTMYFLYIAALGAMAAAAVFALWLINRPAMRPLKWLPLVAALAVVAANLTLNEAMYGYWRVHSGQMLPSGRVGAFVATSPGAAAPEAAQGEFYRVEVPGQELSVRNEGMALGYPSTACYLSVQNRDNLEPLTGLEDIGRVVLHYATGLDDRAALMSLLNVRYYATRADSPQKAPYGFDEISRDKRTAVYQNRYALPLGYSTDSFWPYEGYQALDGLGRQQALSRGAVLKGGERGLKLNPASFADGRVTVPYRISAADGVTLSDGALRVERAGAKLTLSFDGLPDCETYLRFQNFDVDDAPYDLLLAQVTGDGFDKEVYALSNTRHAYRYGQYNYLVNLGYSKEAKKSLTIEFNKAGDTKLEALTVYCLPVEGLGEALSAFAAQPLTGLKLAADRVEGDVDFSADRVLVLGIPYSDAWRAQVDGKDVPIDPSNGLVMALPLAAGKHHVVLTYENPWWKPGLLASALGLAALIALWIFRRRRPAGGVAQPGTASARAR